MTAELRFLPPGKAAARSWGTAGLAFPCARLSRVQLQGGGFPSAVQPGPAAPSAPASLGRPPGRLPRRVVSGSSLPDAPQYVQGLCAPPAAGSGPNSDSRGLVPLLGFTGGGSGCTWERRPCLLLLFPFLEPFLLLLQALGVPGWVWAKLPELLPVPSPSPLPHAVCAWASGTGNARAGVGAGPLHVAERCQPPEGREALNWPGTGRWNTCAHWGLGCA